MPTASASSSRAGSPALRRSMSPSDESPWDRDFAGPFRNSYSGRGRRYSQVSGANAARGSRSNSQVDILSTVLQPDDQALFLPLSAPPSVQGSRIVHPTVATHPYTQGSGDSSPLSGRSWSQSPYLERSYPASRPGSGGSLATRFEQVELAGSMVGEQHAGSVNHLPGGGEFSFGFSMDEVGGSQEFGAFDYGSTTDVRETEVPNSFLDFPFLSSIMNSTTRLTTAPTFGSLVDRQFQNVTYPDADLFMPQTTDDTAGERVEAARIDDPQVATEVDIHDAPSTHLGRDGIKHRQAPEITHPARRRPRNQD